MNNLPNFQPIWNPLMDHKSESDLIWNPENSFKENKQTRIFNQLKIQNGFAFNSTLNLHSQKQY